MRPLLHERCVGALLCLFRIARSLLTYYLLIRYSFLDENIRKVVRLTRPTLFVERIIL